MDTEADDPVLFLAGAATAFGVAAVLGGAALYNKRPSQALIGVAAGMASSTTAAWLHIKQKTPVLKR